MKTKELELELRSRLASVGFPDPGFEVRQILSHVLSVDAADLLMLADEEVASMAVNKARDWAEQRSRGVPLAYLSGVKGFYKFDFLVKPGVLIPRPETELVVEEALARVRDAGLKVKAIADLGCGSGCIGLSVLSELHEAQLFAIDSSEVSCEITMRNAQSLQAEDLVSVVNRDVLNWQPTTAVQLVVANPPYIAEGDPKVENAVHDHEPHAALYSGKDGLEAIRAWSNWVFTNLASDGIFVCEIGAGQSPMVRDIISKLGFTEVRTRKDLAGIERVISGQKR